MACPQVAQHLTQRMRRSSSAWVMLLIRRVQGCPAAMAVNACRFIK